MAEVTVEERRNEGTEIPRFWKYHPCEWWRCQIVDYSGRKVSSEQGETVDKKLKNSDWQEPKSLGGESRKEIV